jgi:hypothetical protein
VTQLIDMTGRRCGRLVVLSRGANTKAGVMWMCRCDCGREKAVLGEHLRRERVRSCGCLRGEISSEFLKRSNRTHGMYGTPTYRSYRSMISRCSPTHVCSHRYFERGITICGRWDPAKGGIFENFLADMGERPPDRSLDRIDPDGNYEPANCRWATASEQARNKSAR